MALPVTGPIALGQINTELGVAVSAQISLGDTAVRALLGVASGAISVSNGRGKSSQFVFTKTLSSNVLNYNLRNDMVASGYSGSGAFTANLTVATGVYVWSDNTSLPGFDTGTLSGGTVNITNNGYIIGKGGAGASGAGGAGMQLGTSVNITNNSYICGGGGGGGNAGGGGGAGGGVGGNTGGGAGGGVGAAGASGGGTFVGGGGGRILPGTGGAGGTMAGGTGGGSGGGGSGVFNQTGQNRQSPGGGGGGGWGASGGAGSSAIGPYSGSQGGPGGSEGAAGTKSSGAEYLVAGGVGGKAVALNGYAVTWNATGTRYGAIS